DYDVKFFRQLSFKSRLTYIKSNSQRGCKGMVVLCTLLFLLLIIQSVYFLYYKSQIKEIGNQLAFIQKHHSFKFSCLITKNMLISISIGIVLVMNVFGMMVRGIEIMLFDNTFVSDYLLVNTITQIKDFESINDLMHVGSVAVVSIILFK